MSVTTRQEFKDYCLHNKYSKWYFSLIEKAELRGWNKKTAPVYVEAHHIVPKSIVPNNELVYLTAREHFICHMLLPKMLEDGNKNKMLYALWNISHHMPESRKLKINSSSYNSIKTEYSKLASLRNKKENNPMFGKYEVDHPAYGYKHTEEHKAYMSSLMCEENNPMFGKKHGDKFYRIKSKNYSFKYDNERIDVFNLRQFCRDKLLDQGAMTRVNTGKQMTHKGYSKWQ